MTNNICKIVTTVVLVFTLILSSVFTRAFSYWFHIWLPYKTAQYTFQQARYKTLTSKIKTCRDLQWADVCTNKTLAELYNGNVVGVGKND